MTVLTGLSGIRPFNEIASSLTYGWPLLVVAFLVALCFLPRAPWLATVLF